MIQLHLHLKVSPVLGTREKSGGKNLNTVMPLPGSHKVISSSDVIVVLAGESNCDVDIRMKSPTILLRTDPHGSVTHDCTGYAVKFSMSCYNAVITQLLRKPCP
jgi:hypothetical protein